MSLRKFATKISYSSGHVSQIETGAKTPTQRFVELCEQELELPGQLGSLIKSNTTVRPAQQPAGCQDIFGRDDEVASIVDNLREGGTTLVVGPPGVGKTALALHCTRDPDVIDRYPDGILYADLHGFTPDRTPAQVADTAGDFLSALEVKEGYLPQSENARLGLLRSILARRQVLVVLDNAWTEEQVRSLLPGNERCGAVVTTRRRMASLTIRDGAARLTLPQLERASSRELLARMTGHRIDPLRVAEMAELCGHWPLALRVIGDRLITSPDIETAALCSELRTTPISTLSENEDPLVAVRASFEASYRVLPPLERDTFRLLGLLPGNGVDLDDVAALADVPRPEARIRLRRLWQEHLVCQSSQGLWTVPTLLHTYAGELAASEDAAEYTQAAASRLHDHRAGQRTSATRASVPEP